MYNAPGIRSHAVPATTVSEGAGLSARDVAGRAYAMDISSHSYIGEILGFEFFTTASRFTGASVAGLVVGAMGCFIFGLYLRRWLRERNSAA